MRFFIIVLQLFLCLYQISSSYGDGRRSNGFCPTSCSCEHFTVRCHRKGVFLPRGVPSSTKRLYLSGSKIRSLKFLRDLPNLVSISLANTGLVYIHPDSFSQCTKLDRLDLSYNNLSKLTERLLKSIKGLKILQVNNNKLTCIDSSIKNLVNLQVLNLQENLLTSIPQEAFLHMKNLRQLRLENNQIHCSCSVRWLARFLRQHPELGIGLSCSSPASLKQRSISTLLPHQLPCSENEKEDSGNEVCILKSFQCPLKCKCSKGTVDCRSLGLTEVPTTLPYDTVELRLEKNLISSLPEFAFASAPKLKRIDISRNRISQISSNAFRRNRRLTTLIFYDNNLQEIPDGLFHGLKHLHMLLLNKNRLTCLPGELFRDQKNLILLSLFDNQLQTLPKDLFSTLKNIRTLHLGLNPWDCSCHLTWLNRFLKKKGFSTSAAECRSPARLRGLELSSDFPESCTGPNVLEGQCKEKMKCPEKCSCTGESVNCTGVKLTTLPQLSSSTVQLVLDHNNIKNLQQLCQQTPQLRRLSVRNSSLDELSTDLFRGCSELEHLDLSGNDLTELENNSFKGLDVLKSLDVSENRLVCLESAALKSLKNLKEVRMDTGFLPCNCGNLWIAAWLNEKTGGKSTFDCNLHCTETEELDQIVSCDVLSCPAGCRCKDRVIRCGENQLEEIPRDLSSTAIQIYLDHNWITEISADSLRTLVNAKLIDLSNNRIEYLDSSSFPYLPVLETVILSNNRIRCLNSGTFSDLPSLKVLSLHDNDISMMKEDIFHNIRSITHIEMSKNPLHCDCKLEWLSRWFKEGVEAGTAICGSPNLLKNRSVTNVPLYYFFCSGRVATRQIDKCNPCYTSPCLNGGFCITEQNSIQPATNLFRCECSPSHYGERCEFEKDACFDNPCRHDGNCTLTQDAGFRCSCVPGYNGRVCERNIDDCRLHKCRNNASCVDKVGGYECSCQDGFEGKYCQNRVSIPLLYFCSGHLCQNGGECIPGSQPGEYSCRCRPPYTGRYCQDGPSISVMYQRTSPCIQHDCKHGICQEDPNEHTYTCVCHNGYSGKRCEYLTTVEYRKSDSYIELDPLYTARPVNITMMIKTKEESGVLLYHGDKQHLAVELFHARIRVSLDIGNQPVSTMYSYSTLNDGMVHSVQIQLFGKTLILTIDGGQPRTVVNEGSMAELSVLQPTFIGGVPSTVGESAVSQWHLRNATSFSGCIKEFYLEDKLIDFLQAARKRRFVEAGCFTRHLGMPFHNIKLTQSLAVKKKKRKKDCNVNKCNPEGTKKCRRKGRRDYRCKCKPGWGGRYCEIAPTCRKRKEKKFLEENNCRSRKQVSVKRCRGICHDGNCCKGKKLKKRKVGMVCNDGTRYVKMVTTVKKCECSRRKKCSIQNNSMKNRVN